MLMVMKCPSCNADLKVDTGHDFYFCSYCGTKILNVAQKVELSGNISIDNSASIANLLVRANRFIDDRMYFDALNCYSKILDMDVNNSTANSGYYYCKALLTNNRREKQFMLIKSLNFMYNETVKREYDKISRLLVINIEKFPGTAAVKFSLDGSKSYTDIRTNYYEYDGELSAGTHRIDFSGYTRGHETFTFKEGHACQCIINIRIKDIPFIGYKYIINTEYKVL